MSRALRGRLLIIIMRKAYWAMGALFLALLAFSWHHRESRKPDPALFVGRWKLDPSSLPSVVARTGKTPSDSHLELAADGRATLADMPVMNSFASPKFQLLSRQAGWELELQQSWMINLVYDGGGHSYAIQWEGDTPAALVEHIPAADSGEQWIWRKDN